MESLIRADQLLTIGIAIYILKGLVEYFLKKLNSESNKENNMNDLFIKHMKESSERALNYADELSEIKKLILNQSNMSTCDFQVYMKTLNQLLYYHLCFEFDEIIENNNINEKTLEVTIQKTKNIIEKIFSTHMYNVFSLNFDKQILNEIIRMMKLEQASLESKIQEIITEYSVNHNSEEYLNDARIEAKRNIIEVLNFMNNNLSSHSYNILNGLNLCECS